MINKSLKFIDFVWFSHRNLENYRLYVEDGHETISFFLFCVRFLFPHFSNLFIIMMMKYPYFYGKFFSCFLWKHSFWCFTVKLKIFIGKFVHTSDRLGPKQQPLKLAGLTNNSNRRPEQKLFNYVGHPRVSMFRKIQVVKIKIWSIRSR